MRLPSRDILRQLYLYGSYQTQRYEYVLYRDVFLPGCDIIQRRSFSNHRAVSQCYIERASLDLPGLSERR